MRRRYAAIVVLACLCLGASCPPRPRGTPSASVVARRGKFELRFGVPGALRAPDDVAIRARFVSPSGRAQVVGGFAEAGGFVVRFSPAERGRYRYQVDADAGRGLTRVAEGSFTAVERGLPGLVQVSASHPHRLIREDGARFDVLGENRINIYDPSWNYGHLGISDYVRMMARNGMNTVRVFIVSAARDESRPGEAARPGVIEPVLGRFDERAAADFDELFQAAEENRMYVVLVAFALGFSPGDLWKGWQENPYSAARGGPAAAPSDFFTSQVAQRFAERRLRYILDRWGYSPSLLAVDLLNEPEWDGAIPETLWIPWARHMADIWRAADPYGHLVTVGSVGLQWNVSGDERPWYESPQDDLIQWHLYGKEFYEVHALAKEMRRKTREVWDFEKPVFVGEFAYGGEAKPGYDHTHVGLWSALFSGAGALAHSAPPFNVDSDEWMTPERAHHFRVLADFLSRLPGEEPLERIQVPPSTDVPGLTTWELQTSKDRAVWLLGPERGYGGTVNARVTLRGLPAGRYKLEWWNDVTGDEIQSSELELGFTTTVTVPPFRRHIAGIVRRLTPIGGGPAPVPFTERSRLWPRGPSGRALP